VLSELKGAAKEEARVIGQELLDLVEASTGLCSEELDEYLMAIPRAPKHEKLFLGLKKLVLDDCEFESPLSMDAPSLRKTVFELASRSRLALEGGRPFQRSEIIDKVASELGVEANVVEEGLFGDLKGAARLTRAPSFSGDDLIKQYQLAQIQGALLRAVRLTARVNCASPEAYRTLFRKLKFRRLLYRLKQLPEGGYEIEIEGPFSLFESVTKYGLQLSMVVPALFECRSGSISAQLKWGKERRPLLLEHSWNSPSPREVEAEQRSDVEALLSALRKRQSQFDVAVAEALLDIPGVGLCVPDLEFRAPGKRPVFLEVLGFWSREAVWNRVEWAQSSNHERVIFAVSSRLRVKEEVLPDGHGACLYVYKGTMSAKAILDQVQALAEP
jgi:hypothetical protein